MHFKILKIVCDRASLEMRSGVRDMGGSDLMSRLLPPAAVAPPGDRQPPTSTVILGRQSVKQSAPPD
eukprot:3638787-Prymnesium_polylepis.1